MKKLIFQKVKVLHVNLFIYLFEPSKRESTQWSLCWKILFTKLTQFFIIYFNQCTLFNSHFLLTHHIFHMNWSNQQTMGVEKWNPTFTRCNISSKIILKKRSERIVKVAIWDLKQHLQILAFLWQVIEAVLFIEF